MLLLDADNAASYVRSQGWVSSEARVSVVELPGGVSNIVLHVAPEGSPPFVLKQARQQLRVPQPWYCSVERIWHEIATLQAAERALAGSGEQLAVQFPRVLHQDRENFAFAMTAAPAGHHVWKNALLSGDVDTEVARQCGRLMGVLHRETWNRRDFPEILTDRSYFEDLRVDPYYREVIRQHGALKTPLQDLIDSLDEHCLCLVHGDFSPKNLLVSSAGLLLIDAEVGHRGDPAFDVGFFLSHLALKAIHAGPQYAEYLQLPLRFWNGYQAMLEPAIGSQAWQTLQRRAARHQVACALARVEGKSRVEYLTGSEQQCVRTWCVPLLKHPPRNWRDVHDRLEDLLEQRAA